MIAPRSRESVLLITLDSCRYDTFASAHAPNLKSVGPLHKAQAPSYYTYASHSAMFVGFTPGLAELRQPILNPKVGKLFRLIGAGLPSRGNEGYLLEGRDIIDGFKRIGFCAFGTGAVGWFDPGVPTGRHLTDNFDDFFYPGDTISLNRQIAWLEERLAQVAGDVFLFLNVGETHVPYYHAGAPWDGADNPCIPFQTVDRSADCRIRQRACCEYVDRALAHLLAAFAGSTVLVCGDHGDCWGEDGLWEHGISHAATLTVPLIIRLRGEALAADRAVTSGWWGRMRRLTRLGRLG